MNENVIGVRIKNLRKQRGYKTQEDLAAALRDKFALKTDRAMVGKWEIGYQVPEMYTIKCLAELFNSSMEYLSGNNEKPAIVSDDELGELSLDEADIISVFRKLSPEAQKELVNYARYKAEK